MHLVNSWTDPHVLSDIITSPAASGKEDYTCPSLNREWEGVNSNMTSPPSKMTTFQYFFQQISPSNLDEARYKNEEGFVRGGSVGWHLNPLLLETRYARVHVLTQECAYNFQGLKNNAQK